ncbi:MAG: peptidylprolyl isomerase [Gemmatimonadota bacterium]|nr:peptidylprolyl isomerase [Gemmatimonadota bacterium]
MRSVMALLWAGSFGTLLAQQPAVPAARSGIPVDRVVAVVGSQPILWSNVLEYMNDLQARGQPIPADSAARAAMERDILNQLIDVELMVQRAQREKIEVGDAELTPGVDRRIKEVRAKFPTDAGYREALKQDGFGSPEEYRGWMLEQSRREALQQQLVQKVRAEGKLSPAVVPDSEITRFFNANKGTIGHLPATIAFRQIIVTPKASKAARAVARARADSVLADLRKGADFEKIAKRESMDATKDQGGDLGWRRRGDLLPEFERVAFALPPDQLSPVVETQYGYHIIRVDRVQPAEIKVRHILIRPLVDSADVARAKLEADSVAAALRAGATLDSLYAKHHDPIEEKGIAAGFPVDSLPASYRSAIAGAKKGDIVAPFPIDDPSRHAQKFVVLQITDRSEEREASVKELRDQIRQRLAQERGFRRFIDGLKRETYVSIRL